MIEAIKQALEAYWPQIFGVIGTVAPIMSVMVPKLLNDKKIIKGQSSVMTAVKRFEDIRDEVMESIKHLEEISDTLKENASIPANLSVSIDRLVKSANAKIAELDDKVLELGEFKADIVRYVDEAKEKSETQDNPKDI